MEIRGLLHNPRFARAVILAGVLTAVYLVSNIFVLGGDDFFNRSNTVITPLAAAITSYLFAHARINKKDISSKNLWTGMALGFGLWGVADLIWAFYALVLDETVPYPSIADLAWVIGYVFLYFAMISRFRSLKVIPTRRQIWSISALGLGWLILTVLFVLRPILADFDPQRLLEGIINITYPLADLGLFILASFILVLLREGRYAVCWRLIFAGVLITTLSDLAFSYATWNELYYPDGRVNAWTILIDTGFVLAYITSALGIYIYGLIWDLKETFEIHLKTAPSARCYAFAATNDQNQIISASSNLYCLANGKPGDRYYKMPLGEAVGIDETTLTLLIEKITQQEMLCNEIIHITTLDGQQREIWLTAMAIFNPGHEFSGANFVLSADIDVLEALRLPADQEILGMMKYLLSVAGSRPKDEIQTMRVYFLEIIQLFSSILYQFGGTQFRNALFLELNQTIRQQNLQIKVEQQSITLPDEPKGETLAQALLPLLKTAQRHVSGLIGEEIINDEIAVLEQQFDPTVIRDLDKYHLRAFHMS